MTAYRGSPVRLVLAQMGVALLLAVAFFLWAGKSTGFSALLGGLVCVVTNAVFLWRFFKVPVTGSPQELVKSAYWGEVFKTVLTVVLFICLLTLFRELNYLAVFASFFLTQCVFWFAHLIPN